VLDAVVDMTLSRRLTSLELNECSLSPASFPALARLLRGGILSELGLALNDLFVDGVSAEFCTALRGARLSFLELSNGNLFASAAGGQAVLQAMTGHSTLRVLNVGGNELTSPDAKLAAGAALGSLISAESVLETLICWSLGLGDDALRPLFAAVTQITRLRKLDCRNNRISQDFACDVVLPAVRSNTSLRKLMIVQHDDRIAELEEAEALVNARSIG
jgi:hypothetical protein